MRFYWRKKFESSRQYGHIRFLKMDPKSGFGLLSFICLFTFAVVSMQPLLQKSAAVAPAAAYSGQTQQLAAGEIPDGLTASEWNDIQAQIAASPYRSAATDNAGYVAANPAQGWQVAYTNTGMTQLIPRDEEATSWEWGLQLTRYGYGDGQQVHIPARVLPDEQTVTYEWDDTLTEWWTNDANGLEQGFTLQQRPEMASSNSIADKPNPLILELAVKGTLVPVQMDNAVHFQTEQGMTILTYNKLQVWDATGQSIPAHLELTQTTNQQQPPTIQIIIADAAATYPLTIDPWVQQAYLKASNTDASDYFGKSIAIDGDTIVIGAPYEDSSTTGVNGNGADNSALNAGAAYVFVRSGSSWSQQAYLKASNTDFGDYFGSSVAIAGDTIVIGANGENSNTIGVNGNEADNSISNAGAAYVFVRSGSSWSQQAYLKASNTGASDCFGSSVAIAGDTIVVGAIYEDSSTTGVNGNGADNSASNAGAAYVFVRSGNSWNQQAYLKASNTDASDYFSQSIAIAGDTIVVGADGEDSSATGVNGTEADNSASNAGAAYIFVRSGNSWNQQAYLKASNTAVNDYFGTSVAIANDTIVVGADGEDSSATGVNGDQTNNSSVVAGAAYVFVYSSSSWSQQAYLKASNTDMYDHFGESVAIADGTIVVGAAYEDSSATGVNGDEADDSTGSSGAAYVFVQSNNNWSQQAYLKASNTGASDHFGSSVVIAGDTIVVGAHLEDSNTTGVNSSETDDSADDAGAAYAFFVPSNVSADLSQLIATPTTLFADGADTANITVTLVNLDGDPVPDKEVIIETTGYNLTITQPITVTNMNGQVMATLMSTDVQTVTVTAVDVSDDIILTQQAIVTFTHAPADITNSYFTISPTLLLGDGNQYATITATLQDRLGRPLANRPIELHVTGGSNLISPTAQLTTDADGFAVFTLASTLAETKQVALYDMYGDTTLPVGILTFTAVPVDPAISEISVRGSRRAAADGQHVIMIEVTALDRFRNPLPDIPVTFTSTSPVDFVQQTAVTNFAGRATGYVRSTNATTANVGAIIDGIVLSKTVQVLFEGPDLAISYSGPDKVTTGYPMTYTIALANEGFLTATNILITQTLPGLTTLISPTGSYPFTYDAVTNTIVWQVGSLAAGEQLAFDVQAQVDAPAGNMLVSSVQTTAAEVELDTANNIATANTQVEVSKPNLVVSPPYPTLDISEGLSNTLVITIQNRGTAVLRGVTITEPRFLPWVSLNQINLGDLLPGASITVTLTGDASGLTQNGLYRDRVKVSSTDTDDFDIMLTVRVEAPLRDVALTLTNDISHTVSNAHVVLIESIHLETEGVITSTLFYRESYTDENGQILFPGLESGKSYDYQITAENYTEKTGYINVPVGSGTFSQSIVLEGQPALMAQPDTVELSMLRGDLAQKTVLLHNTGNAPITDISLTSTGIPFLYLGQPPIGTVLNPGQVIAVSVNAAPLLTETIGVDAYRGNVMVETNTGTMTTIPVQVNLLDVYARTLCIRTETDRGEALTQGFVRLKDLEGQVVSSGNVTETVQMVYQQSTDHDGPGYTCFPDLRPGRYHADVGRGDIRLGQAEIILEVGDRIQEEVIIVDEPSITADFTIIPTTIPDVYTTVLTMTFIPYEVPRLMLSPQRINLCDDADGVVTETLTLHNFFPVTLTTATLSLEYYGDISVTVTSPDGFWQTDGRDPLLIGDIPPESHLQFELQATVDMAACVQDVGIILITVEAKHPHYVPESWYRIDATPKMVPLGQEAHIPMRLANIGFPESSNLNGIPPTLEDVTLVPPQHLTWITTSVTTIDEIPVGEEVAFDLIVKPPPWLSNGTYYDQIQVYATNGITALIGIKAEMTNAGLRVETQFVTPLTAGQGGTPPPPSGDNPPQHSQPQPPWDNIVTNWNPDIFGPQDVLVDSWDIVVGCYCSQSGGSSDWLIVGNSLVVHGRAEDGNFSFAHSSDFKDNVVILRLEQRFSLDREAFNASLALNNALATKITDVEVSLIFTNGPGGESIPTRLPGDILTPTGTYTPVLPSNSIIPYADLTAALPARWQKIYPVNFIIIPETPTDIGTIPGGSSQFINWTLVPDAPGLMEQGFFDVQAIIRYKVDGEEKELITTPASISVSPQPRIMLDYYLPNYVLGGETFDWLVVATNLGYGTARNFRVETPQPKIIKQSERYPTDFTLIGPSVLEWGNVAPGEQVSGTWRIQPSRPGSFVDWEATCKHQNFMGVELPQLVYCEPRIHIIDTSYLAESQQWGKGDSCLSGLFQAFSSDPVNTFSGNFTYSELDLSIPTWGDPLTFERSYNSRDIKDGPLGPGWTHNFNMDLTYESFMGMDVDGIIGQQIYFSARLPHGSMAYFNVSPDGYTITPFPGVQAQLIHTPSASYTNTYTLTQDCDQTIYTFNAAQRLSSIQDVNGNRTTLIYDDNDNLTQVMDPAGRILTFIYDNGYLTHMTDWLGRTMTYSYTQGYLTAVSDFRGQVTQYKYTLPDDQPGQLMQIIDPNGHTIVHNQYDVNRRVAWQEDALGYHTTFSYVGTTENRVTTMTDPLGNTTTDTYNEDGLIIARRDLAGNTETYAYDENYKMIQQTNKNGHTTLYNWPDNCCDMDLIVDPMGNTTRMTFGPHNEVLSIENERGYLTAMTYDGNLNLLTATDALGGVVAYTYGPHGEKLSETDENGNVTTYTYDSNGNLTTITDALGNTVTMQYDAVGRLLETTDPLGRTTLYSYNGEDNLLTTTYPLSGTFTFGYDNVGNLIRSTNPLDQITTYVYNERNELVETINPLGGHQTFSYDAIGTLIAQTDENGNLMQYDHDYVHFTVTTTDAAGYVSSVTTDAVGNTLRETDANGNVTQYNYDANDRLMQTTYADGSTAHYLYDAADNLIAITDGENRTVRYGYDALGRLIQETNPLSGTTTYTYDAVGNQISMIDAAGHETQYVYDAVNRLVQIIDPFDKVISYTYDVVGNKITYTDVRGHTAVFTYDPLNRLIQITDPLSGTTTYAYDALGNQIEVADPLGRVTQIAYDALSRPITLTNAAGDIVTYQYDGVSNLTAITDEEGHTTSYAYDGVNQPVTITDPAGGVFTYVYDGVGNLQRDTDPLGRTTTYAYDTLNQIITMNNPLNGTTAYTYDHVGNRIATADANGRITTYTYDSLDRVVAMQNALGDVTQYHYDAIGNLLQLTDAAGNDTVYTYDVLNRPTTIIDALGGAAYYQYDAAGNLLQMTDAAGRSTTFQYDALNRMIQITDALGQDAFYAYDAVGNHISLQDVRGFTTTYGYDVLNQLITTTNPLSGTAVYTYTAAGNLLAERNPAGQVTTYHYDALDRPIRITDPLAHLTHYTYDPLGNLTAVTDPLSRTTTFAYDPLNRLVQTTDVLNGVTISTYDLVGNLLTITDANGHMIAYQYDDLDRLIRVTDPLSQVTSLTYDPVGNQLTLTDPLSRTISYTYDSLYRLVQVTDPSGGITQYAYDAVGNNIAIIDAENRTTTAQYDALDRPLTMTNPLSGTISFTYDAAGNQTSQTDPEGHTTRYAYDALSRLQQMTDAVGSITTYQYDPLGNLLTITDPLYRVTTYTYDDRNRLTTVIDPLAGMTTFGYDAIGNLLQEVDPLGHITTYTYDALNRMVTITDALGATTTSTYDLVGNLLTMTDANGHTTTMTYDPLDRLQTVTDSLGRTSSYLYDAVGNNTAIVDPLGQRTDFSYDALDRLLIVTDPLTQTTTYSYDRVGNTRTLVDGNGIVTQYDYDPLNRLIQVTENVVSDQPGASDRNVTTQYGYDRIGNLLAITNPLGNVTSFSYDPLDRLVSAIDPLGFVTTYTYDAVGNLAQQTDPNGSTTNYSYDALDRLTLLTRPDEVVTYSYDAVGNRLSMGDGTGMTQYQYDALYRPVQVTDPLSQVVTYGYDAVGNRTSLLYPDGAQVHYSYDAADQLTTVTDWDSGLTEYVYDANGRLVQVLLPNQITGTLAYDAADHLTLLRYDIVTSTLASYIYTYDAVGNRTQAMETVVQSEILPTAAFTATPRIGTVPLTVTFHNASTNATHYRWDFGDGQVITTTDIAPLSHVYTQIGTYTITLTAETSEFSHVLVRTTYIQVLPPNVFQEVNGQVVLEAEQMTAMLPRDGHRWITRTTFISYTGANYLQLLPDIDALYDSNYESNSPELQYAILFNTPGTYVVWVYGSGSNAGADSLHIGLNGSAIISGTAITRFPPQQWYWSAQTSSGLTATLTIPSPGFYTLNVWGREDGFRLDRILLTQNTNYVPDGQGPPASPLASNSTFTPPSSDTMTWFTVKSGDHVASKAVAAARVNALMAMLSNPGLLLMGPLALLSPMAKSRRRRRWAQVLTGVLLVLAMFGVGYALVLGGNLSSDQSGLQLPTVPELAQRGARFNPKLAATTQMPQLSAMATLAQQQTRVIDYSYDSLYRLTSASYNTGKVYDYSYDMAGNRIGITQNGVPVATYLYNAANQLVEMNSQVYTYDQNGNLLDDGGFTYTYDTANRLTQASDGISTAQYQYNGDGVRVAQIMDGLRTDYVQDTIRPLPQVLTARQGGTVSKYLQGLGLIGEQRGGTGQFAPSPTWHYLLADALGSIRQITDASGQVIGNQDFDPFGGLTATAGNATTAYGFAGEEQDPLTGYLYLRARTYNPANGRFLQQDSLLGDLSQPRTLHRYAYAFNNPVTYTDPSGHMPSYNNRYSSPSHSSGAPGKGSIPKQSWGGASRSWYNLRPKNKQSDKTYYIAERGPGGLCGSLIGVIESGKDLAHELIDLGENYLEMTKDVVEFFKDGDVQHLKDAQKDLKLVAENAENILNNPLIETALIMAISFSPVGTVFDVIGLITGVDPWTGEKLSDLDKALAVAGLFMGGFEDLEMLLPSGSFGGGLDEVSDLGHAGDELNNFDDALDDANETNALGELGDADELSALGDAHQLSDLESTTELRRGGKAAMDYTNNPVDLNHFDDATDNLDEMGEVRKVQPAQDPGNISHVDEATPTHAADSTDFCLVNSFSAGTLVATDEGLVPIEDIEVGDQVLGADPETGEQAYFEVVALTDHPTDEILKIVVSTDDDEKGKDQNTHDNGTTYDVMLVTPEHPVYVEGRGWVLAENLGLGERLHRADGGMAKVLAIDQPEVSTPQSVYNFTVEGVHAYFVLDASVLVHNAPTAPSCGWGAPKTEEDKELYDLGYQEAEKQIATYDEVPVFGRFDDLKARLGIDPKAENLDGANGPVLNTSTMQHTDGGKVTWKKPVNRGYLDATIAHSKNTGKPIPLASNPKGNHAEHVFGEELSILEAEGFTFEGEPGNWWAHPPKTP